MGCEKTWQDQGNRLSAHRFPRLAHAQLELECGHAAARVGHELGERLLVPCSVSDADRLELLPEVKHPWMVHQLDGGRTSHRINRQALPDEVDAHLAQLTGLGQGWMLGGDTNVEHYRPTRKLNITCENASCYDLEQLLGRYAPFVIEIAPWLPASRALEDDATQRPDVHRTVTSMLVVPDDFRRHVHGRSREGVIDTELTTGCGRSWRNNSWTI